MMLAGNFELAGEYAEALFGVASMNTETRLIDLPDCSLEIAVGGAENSTLPTICAAHPAGAFSQNVVELLSWTANTRVVCVNLRGTGKSSPVSSGHGPYDLEQMVDDIEQVRVHLGIERWVFWGMSGGGWLGQIYALEYADALEAVLLESVCACFRVRLADPECILSPFHPSWRPALEQRGLITEFSHAEGGDAGATAWVDVEGVGAVFRRRGGPALLVSPTPVAPEMRRAMPVLWSVDTRPWLGQIPVSTLVVCGTADPIVPVQHARALHERIPGSEIFLARDGGHAPVTQRRPEMVEAVRRFLQRTAGPPEKTRPQDDSVW